LASLTQLMLDPYYRSMRGFALLIEKEWCSYGHKFAERCGHYMTRDSSESETSPVFIQFLDCVWQLQLQFPMAFEFNERLLLFLAAHAYSGLYGTLLANNDARRKQADLRNRTVSIWSHIFDSPSQFTNARYDPDQVHNTLTRPAISDLFSSAQIPITPRSASVHLDERRQHIASSSSSSSSVGQSSRTRVQPLWPIVSVKKLQLWRQLFFRFNQEYWR
jgi:Myotubularin-like phosphatase domain